MSLDVFQRVFAALAGDAALCAAAHSDGPTVFENYDLTPLERRRLAGLAAQPGMRINGLLQRANRFTPLPRLYPLTCAVLGPELPRIVHAFWAAWPHSNMQFDEESGRFAAFLRSCPAAEKPLHSALPAVLDLEAAILDLRFARPAPRCSLLHHRVRVVAFRHDPERVLAAAQADQQPPDNLPAGEYVVLVDGRGEDPQVLLLSAGPGRILLALALGEQPGNGDADIARLAAAGLLAQST